MTETPLLLVSERDRDVDEAVLHLGRIGIDNVRGALAGDGTTATIPTRMLGRACPD